MERPRHAWVIGLYPDNTEVDVRPLLSVCPQPLPIVYG